MKWIIAVVSVMIASLFVGMSVIVNASDPEELLIGSWKEASWKYEKYGHNSQEDEQLNEVSQNLIVHKAEIWNFNNDKSFVISPQKPSTKASSWHVKGRGNILELKEGSITEHYQIENITQNSLTLYFSFDLQVRGIVKITFKRVK